MKKWRCPNSLEAKEMQIKVTGNSFTPNRRAGLLRVIAIAGGHARKRAISCSADGNVNYYSLLEDKLEIAIKNKNTYISPSSKW